MTRAFTIVELLVVITIIVVLLALLAPALDKAVHEAAMAKCGAQLKGVGAGVLIYAADHRRAYLDRRQAQNSQSPKELRFTPRDDRPVLSRYVQIKALLCPLTPGVADLAGSMDNSVASTYYLFFGHRYGNLKPMRRLGDRWEGPEGSYNLLASDNDEISGNAATAYSSHPDVEDRMEGEFGEGIMYGPFGPYTFSRWRFNVGGQSRPPISSQHAFDDNSVVRFDEVRWDEHLIGGGLERMDQVPVYTSNQSPTLYFHVPKSSR